MEINKFKESFKKNKITIFIWLWLIVLLTIYLIFIWGSAPNMNPLSSSSGSTASGTTQTVGTKSLLNQLNWFIQSMDSALKVDSIYSSDSQFTAIKNLSAGEQEDSKDSVYILKFKCVASDADVTSVVNQWSKASWENYDLSKVNQEQKNLFKKRLESYCEYSNSVLINKWLVFYKTDNWVIYKEITPWVLIKLLKDTLPVWYQNKQDVSVFIAFLQEAFSYEHNINTIFDTDDKKLKIKNSYQVMYDNFVEFNGWKAPDSTLKAIFDKLNGVIWYYTE